LIFILLILAIFSLSLSFPIIIVAFRIFIVAFVVVVIVVVFAVLPYVLHGLVLVFLLGARRCHALVRLSRYARNHIYHFHRHLRSSYLLGGLVIREHAVQSSLIAATAGTEKLSEK
jgi:hypothetical protein